MIVWTEYMLYRAELRGFDLAQLEQIMKSSIERYYDTETGRFVLVGRHNNQLVMLPYEVDGESVIPVTVHATTREQINFRLKTGRFTNE
jgi:hypothetical protein